MSNTNRDYAIVYDVKNSSLVLSRPLIFYITDKNTSNIFVRLVTIVDVGNGIDQYTDLEPASNYALTMRVIKPNNEVKSIEATQHEPESIFQFDLTEDFKDIPGKYICELTISTIVNSRQELITSDPFNYEVKRSILSNVGEIIETEDTTVEKLLNNLDATKAELSSQIKEKANNSDLAVERARIDSFTKLAEGSTTGDAELIDGRIGEDGITYGNLGNAIRNQISNINDKINNATNGIDLKYGNDYGLEWKLGTVNYKGEFEASSNRYRYDTMVFCKKGTTIKIDSGYRFFVCGFRGKNSTEMIVYSDWYTDEYTLERDLYVILVVATLDSSLIDDVKSINKKIRFIATNNIIDRINEKIANINNGIDLKNGEELSLEWKLGTVNYKGELEDISSFPYRYRYDNRVFFKKGTTVRVKDLYKFFVCGYTSETSEGLIVYSDFVNEYTFEIDMYAILVFAVQDSSLIDDVSIINKNIEFITPNNVLSEINNIKENAVIGIPSYFKDNVDSKVNIIREKMSVNPYDKITFFHISDQHYPNNSNISYLLMNEINNKCNINLCVNTGDFIKEQVANKSVALDYALKANKGLQKVNKIYLPCVGNHDDNANYGHTDSNRTLSNAILNGEYYNYLFKNIENVNFGDTGKYYYYDDKFKKVRFIILDCFDNDNYEVIESTNNIKVKPYEISVNQINWLINKAFNVDNDYSVIVFSHCALTSTEYMSDSIKNWDLIRTVLNGFKNKTNGGWTSGGVDCSFDFRSNSSIFIGCFAGHVHLDIIKQDTESHIMHNIIINDSCVNDLDGQPTRTMGTVTECAFDVVIVDTKTKHVDLVRIGAGSDREFDY